VSGTGPLVVLVLLVLVTTACASRSGTFASRFITEGTPSIDVGGIEVPVHGRLETPPKAVMPPVPPRRSVAMRPSANLSTLESVSARLQHALAALAAEPSSSAYLEAALAYQAEGVADRAFDTLTEGLQHDRSDPALHDAQARAWRDWGFPDRALSASRRAVYFDPRSPEARNTLGTVLWALGQRGPARVAFAEATQLDARASYAWHNLCEVALAEGRTRDATAMCRRARALLRTDREPRR